MPTFAKRSYQKELLDRDDIPFEDIKRNMTELNFINKYLGGHNITISGLRHLLSRHNIANCKIVEVGSGGGDNLKAVKVWADKQNIPVDLIGIDINPECIEYAKQVNGNNGYTWISSDYRHVVFKEKPDIIFSSLFLHHFAEEGLVSLVKWMHTNSSHGFFINDLHRHPIAYYFIKALTRVFSQSYLVKNDAPLSVLRGFKRNDWSSLFSMANVPVNSIEWRWAFRWLIISIKNNGDPASI